MAAFVVCSHTVNRPHIPQQPVPPIKKETGRNLAPQPCPSAPRLSLLNVTAD